jgi:hypothetical protein
MKDCKNWRERYPITLTVRTDYEEVLLNGILSNAWPRFTPKTYPRPDMETEGFHENITIGSDNGHTLEFNVIRLKHFPAAFKS